MLSKHYGVTGYLDLPNDRYSQSRARPPASDTLERTAYFRPDGASGVLHAWPSGGNCAVSGASRVGRDGRGAVAFVAGKARTAYSPCAVGRRAVSHAAMPPANSLTS